MGIIFFDVLLGKKCLLLSLLVININKNKVSSTTNFDLKIEFKPSFFLLVPQLKSRVKAISLLINDSNFELRRAIIDDETREMTFFADYGQDGSSFDLSNFIINQDDHITNNMVIILVFSLKLSNQLPCMPYMMYLRSSLHQSSMLLGRVSTENIISLLRPSQW